MINEAIEQINASTAAPGDYSEVGASYKAAIKNSTEERLLVTDEEALHELELFREQINRISLATRYHLWVAQFVLLVVSLTCIYLSTFARLIHELDPHGETLLSVE